MDIVHNYQKIDSQQSKAISDSNYKKGGLRKGSDALYKTIEDDNKFIDDFEENLLCEMCYYLWTFYMLIL